MATAADGTNQHAFDYDGDRNRVRQTVNSVVTEYLVDRTGGLPEVVAEINSGGNLKVFYVRGLELISQERNGTVRYYGHDGLGSTILLTDLSGLPTDHYRYDAWGNVVATDGVTPNTFRYTGQQRDGTRLYYLRARYYAPHTPRFVSRDPVEGLEDEPVTLHLYCYGRTNPVTHVDPAGAQGAAAMQQVNMGLMLQLLFAMAIALTLQAAMMQPGTQKVLGDLLGSLMKAIAAWMGAVALASLSEGEIRRLGMKNKAHHTNKHGGEFNIDPKGPWHQRFLAYMACAQSMLYGLMQRGQGLVQDGARWFARVPYRDACQYLSDYYTRFAPQSVRDIPVTVVQEYHDVLIWLDTELTTIEQFFVEL